VSTTSDHRVHAYDVRRERIEVISTPSPRSGSRMYFSSQRASAKSDLEPGPGAIFEIAGPFRGAGARAA
jgi:hypothetical protein